MYFPFNLFFKKCLNLHINRWSFKYFLGPGITHISKQTYTKHTNEKKKDSHTHTHTHIYIYIYIYIYIERERERERENFFVGL